MDINKWKDELCAVIKASDIYCKCIPYHPKKALKFEIGGLFFIACLFISNEYLKYNHYEWWLDNSWFTFGSFAAIIAAFLFVVCVSGSDVRDLHNLDRYIKRTSRKDPAKFNKFQVYAKRKNYRVRFDQIPDELR